MKTRFLLPLATVLASAVSTFAADAEPAVGAWRAHTLGEALLFMLMFAVAGIVMAIVGYKVFDKLTPGDLHKEIIENKNVAAAIVAGAMVLGICIIIAAAMIG
jgi:hypothetical protein